MIRKNFYGSYQQCRCPFCNSVATMKNVQGVPVCLTHKKEILENMKCSCNSFLDIKEGKYGVFFLCINCGPVKMKRALDINGYSLKTINDL